jgi:hypothetical protein
MKTNKDQRKKYTLMKIYNKIWTQIKAKKCKLSAVAEKENTRWTIRVKTRVFLANKKRVRLLQKKHDVI